MHSAPSVPLPQGTHRLPVQVSVACGQSAIVEQVHCEFVQVPVVQEVLQAPQFFASVASDVQAEPQHVVPALHSSPFVPAPPQVVHVPTPFTITHASSALGQSKLALHEQRPAAVALLQLSFAPHGVQLVDPTLAA